MKALVFSCLLILGIAAYSFGQETKPVDLPEVEVVAMNYKYLNSVSPEEAADFSIQKVEEMIASYDVKDADFYREDFDHYYVTFYVPDGRILAAYDEDGKIIRTAEKFKNVNLPNLVMDAVHDKFPGWTITKDIYLVSYYNRTGMSKKRYKMKLENMDKIIRVKIDEDGNFM